MMTAFSLQPRQCYGSGLLATAASPRPSIFWRWRQQQQCTMLKYSQVEQQSAQTLHYDNRDEKVDDRLGKNPCNFHPSIWGDFFLHYSNPAASSEQQTWMAERADKLKEEVAKMIASSVTCSLHQRLQLIHVLERLCLDHLFEEEINDALIQIKTADVSDCDLHTVAMWFYLLRKYGYRVIPDVFLRFKDEEGCFFTNNPMDLLSLYNAAHLRTHGETILDEAILFTRRCLETTLLPSLEGSLAREIKCALEIPLPRRVRIYESKYYISTYEKEATVHESVLQLAKLNSNIMQLHHQKELRIVTSWWKDLEIESRFPFVRDRIVECYLWMLGVYFEPCHSRGRIMLTMVIAIITILDDMYDSYGTLEECELLTKCLERWDKKAAHDLPECMKFALGKILDSYQTIEQELAHEEKYRMSYLKAFTVDMVRAFNMEVKMREEGYTPRSVEEHLQFSIWTSGCHVVSCTTFVGMDDIATKDSFDWVSTMPKMVKALCIILRLLDDLQSYEREQLTPHVASTIQSYMTEHNVTIEVARKKIEELKEESWKDFNGEWLNPDNAPPKQLLERIFNLTRTMEFFYNLDDNFSNSQNLRDTILSLFVEHFEVF
ncbi:alpha-terpineol synthase, chloroplastic-like isoform X2 [Phragmites australis]|uniref:alpha-terpineol synthase, chloroplastic-like isoform X2 n=1 Tax=Phragmites australis TaxID=29695 RepID=UPI002D76EFB1|nr:alpha-terpineol synthase, chloroplastic-like isoform X2 [Phragmites australis]